MIKFGQLMYELENAIDTVLKPKSYKIDGFMVYKTQWPDFWVCRIEVKQDKKNLRYQILFKKNGVELEAVSAPKEELDRMATAK